MENEAAREEAPRAQVDREDHPHKKGLDEKKNGACQNFERVSDLKKFFTIY